MAFTSTSTDNGVVNELVNLYQNVRSPYTEQGDVEGKTAVGSNIVDLLLSHTELKKVTTVGSIMVALVQRLLGGTGCSCSRLSSLPFSMNDFSS